MAEQGDMAGLSDRNDKDVTLDKDEKKSKKGKKSKKSKKVDEELSELLNSALDDFNSSGKDDDLESAAQNDSSEKEKPSPPNMLWDEEFMKQTAERLQQSFQSGFGAGDTPLTAEQLGQNIQSLAEAVTQMAGTETSPDAEFSRFFAQTLKQLSETSEAPPTQLSEDLLKNMMSNLPNTSGNNSEIFQALPLILGMVHNLLSKDVLYADVKRITEKYPQWLEENKAKLTSYKYECHTKMLAIFRELRTELEKETGNEGEDLKIERSDRILMLILQAQDLGSVPEEVAGDLSPILSVDYPGLSQFPPNMTPSQCCIS